MYNTMRISGLASGIDTEEMVQSLMKAERMKVDRVEQDKQILLWRQEMYNDVNKDFANFILNSRKDFGLTSVTYDGTFRKNSYKDLNWVKKSTASDPTKVTVSSTAKAMDGVYDVNVVNLAEGVSMASAVDISETIGNNLKDGMSFKINGQTITVNKSGETITMDDVVNAINSAKKKEGGKEVSLDIRASYDAGIGRFFLQTTKTGKDAKIEITDMQGGAKEFIDGLKIFAKDESGKISYTKTGKDAKINFGGAEGITSSSNRITINGVTMDLKGEGDFKVTVGTDVDGIYEKVQKFVDDYNQLVDKTNKLLGEERHRSYKPLTSDQKEAMKENDIKLWEEKAKSGLLRSDDIISRTMLNTRRAVYDDKKVKETFGAKFKLITELGISTEKYSKGSAGGRLVIDEQKLKKAIADDPDGVMELLFKESTPEEKDKDGKVKKEYKPGGLVSRIHDNLMGGMEDIIKKSGTAGQANLYRDVKGSILLEFISGSHNGKGSISFLDDDILKFNRKIDDLNTMLFRKENHYYAKFAAMEKAISKMNEQSGWLMQQAMG